MRHNHQIIRNMTRNQILKSIATAQKAIEKATKNVAMYTTRRDNAIAKANKKGYNLSVESFQVTERFVKTYHDGQERNIYARMIWAAEYSMFVSPHTRYIVTEKH